MFGRVARNTVLLVAAQGVASVLGIATAAVAARGLGAAGFGRLSLLLSAAAALQMVADFGLGTVLVRDLARRPERARTDLVAALVLRSALGAAAGLVLAALALAAVGPFGGEAAPALALALTPLAAAVAGVGRAAIRARERMEWILLLTAAEAAGRLVLTWAAVEAGTGLTGVAVAATAAPAVAAVGALAAGWGLVQAGSDGKWVTRVSPLVREAWPFALCAVVGVLAGKLDVFLVATVLGDVAAGLFSAGARVLDALRAVSAAAFGAVLPALSRALGRDTDEHGPARERRLAERLGLAALVGSAAVAAPIALAPSSVLGTLYGPGYASAAPVLAVQVLAIVPYAWGTVQCARLTVHGRGLHIAAADGAGALVHAALFFLLAPRFGLVGAAVATVAREAVTAGLYRMGIRAYRLRP